MKNAAMTETQATDEALLLFIRKMRRMHPDAFADVWGKVPGGAQTALLRAEMRADVYRDHHTPAWPVEADLDEGDEE